MSWLHKKYIWW